MIKKFDRKLKSLQLTMIIILVFDGFLSIEKIAARQV